MNILADQAEDQRQEREAQRSEFHRWIEQQAGQDDRVGDLARDIRRDRRVPSSEAGLDGLQAYARRGSKDSGALSALQKAKSEFKAPRS